MAAPGGSPREFNDPAHNQQLYRSHIPFGLPAGQTRFCALMHFQPGRPWSSRWAGRAGRPGKAWPSEGQLRAFSSTFWDEIFQKF